MIREHVLNNLDAVGAGGVCQLLPMPARESRTSDYWLTRFLLRSNLRPADRTELVRVHAQWCPRWPCQLVPE